MLSGDAKYSDRRQGEDGRTGEGVGGERDLFNVEHCDNCKDGTG